MFVDPAFAGNKQRCFYSVKPYSREGRQTVSEICLYGGVAECAPACFLTGIRRWSCIANEISVPC